MLELMWPYIDLIRTSSTFQAMSSSSNEKSPRSTSFSTSSTSSKSRIKTMTTTTRTKLNTTTTATGSISGGSIGSDSYESEDDFLGKNQNNSVLNNL